MFEKASRLGLRFQTSIGALTTEDLWTLPLTHPTKPSLDRLAQDLNQMVQKAAVSFVEPTRQDSKTELAFEIVKHIIQVRLAEKEHASFLLAAKAKREKIQEIIDRKKDNALAEMSLEDLEKLAQTLS